MSNFMFGCDPEVFLRSKKTGEFISAAGKFPGTKDEPHRIHLGAVQVDGLALEFNIDAVSSPEEFQFNVDGVKAQLVDMVHHVDPDLEMVYTPFANFDARYFESLDDDCKILGCDPDFNCINGQVNPSPSGLQNRPFRTAAGHIHIGWTSNENVVDPIHCEDARFIAEKMAYICADISYENRRRQQYYGRPGAFRPKTYGVEIRSPSNLWVSQKNGGRDMINRVIRILDSIESN